MTFDLKSMKLNTESSGTCADLYQYKPFICTLKNNNHIISSVQVASVSLSFVANPEIIGDLLNHINEIILHLIDNPFKTSVQRVTRYNYILL